jgi:hypothetical protein
LRLPTNHASTVRTTTLTRLKKHIYIIKKTWSHRGYQNGETKWDMFWHLCKHEFTITPKRRRGGDHTPHNFYTSASSYIHVKYTHRNHFVGFSSIFRVTNPIRHKGAQNLKLNNPTFFKQLYSFQTRFFFF